MGSPELRKNHFLQIDKAFDKVGESGIYMTDGQAKTMRVNKAYESLTEIGESEVLGRYMGELEESGYYDRSVTLLVLKHRSVVSIEQSLLRNRKKIVVTGNPVFNQKGDIILVVTVVRPTGEYPFSIERENLPRVSLPDIEGVVAASRSMQEVLMRAARVALVDSTVLLLGETGVGKEVVARIIHQLSTRRNKPFIKVNLGAIPEDLFESEMFGYRAGAFTGASRTGKMGLVQAADGGTLFLDEVSEAPPSVQVKLLRLLQEKEVLPVGSVNSEQVDVRFIAASNRDLYTLVQSGVFREDLYYRLNVVPIRIRPLRERREDIYAFIQYFMYELNQRYRMDKQFNPQAVQTLIEYSWPGNVRELRNMVERLAVLTSEKVITCEHVASETGIEIYDREGEGLFSELKSYREATADFEKHLIGQLLNKTGSMEEAAKLMGMHRTTLLRKARKYHLV